MMLKKLSMGIIASLVASASVTAGESAVLITATPSGADLNVVVEYAGDKRAVGLQLDMNVKGMSDQTFKASTCRQAKASNQMGVCAAKRANTLQVAMVNQDLEPIASGVIAEFTIPGGAEAATISVDRFLLADASANEWSGEAVIDAPAASRSDAIEAVRTRPGRELN